MSSPDVDRELEGGNIFVQEKKIPVSPGIEQRFHSKHSEFNILLKFGSHSIIAMCQASGALTQTRLSFYLIFYLVIITYETPLKMWFVVCTSRSHVQG